MTRTGLGRGCLPVCLAQPVTRVCSGTSAQSADSTTRTRSDLSLSVLACRIAAIGLMRTSAEVCTLRQRGSEGLDRPPRLVRSVVLVHGH